ncbi:hypothetical protein [Streptomyces flavofungini]|uniref:hypothetical protein n=1 Tax=Streptomyces flavofungini TaxID=68200 RepID=UPI0025AF4E2F|nr:hypothetical protein [Streptomyces flavofungini]WJV48544.1 hypothetical protein QUY26_25320 [Streptomyces flavofungini]
MRRGLVHTIAWSLATGAAVTLSWWGVRTVMAGTAYDPPRALPLMSGDRSALPQSSSTHRPEPTAGPSKPKESGKPSGSERPRPTKTPKPAKTPRRPAPERPGPHPSPSRSSSVKGYHTEGGRVVFDLGEASATLVSAAPAAGWSMQVWKAPTWIRVEYTSGADRVSVFCTWHDHAPRVDVTTY